MTVLTDETTKLITGEELLAMGDVGPCELIDGEIVTMSPTGGMHGFLESLIAGEIYLFVRQNRTGFVLNGEVGIYIRRNPDRIRAADVAFWSTEKLPEGPPVGFVYVAPDLVVEILSPNDRWEDVRRKIDDYFSIGVSELWIVEPENSAVLVYTSPTKFDVLQQEDTLTGSGPLEGFSLSVAELFTV